MSTMKKLRFSTPAILLGFLLTAGASFAGTVKLGAHGGLSIPNIRGNDTNIFSRGFTSRRGPFFGLAADIGLSTRFSLATEFNYSSQGGLRKGLQPITMELPPGLPLPPGTLLFADFRNETILDYLEVPILARLSFGGKVRYFVNAGPYFGLLIRARAVTAGESALYLDEGGTQPVIVPPSPDPLVVDLGADTDVIESLNRTNVGLAGGGGVIYPLGAVELILEARFQLGLTTIQKDIETSGKTQTGAIVISLEFMFPLGKHR